MKKLFLFVLAVVMFNATAGAADVLNRIHPNNATVKIEGNFNVKVNNGVVSYELTNVVPTGLKMRQEKVFYGKQPDGREVMFTFDQIQWENPSMTNFDNISYWYYDSDINDWQPDVEIRKGERTNELRKDITMVLIIDCSNSLRNDFQIVKNATRHFIDQMYQAAPNGNVHIGIIGFSSMPDTKILPIQPLNSSTYGNMRSFISNLTVNNGTALFYAFDKAIDQTEKYIASGKMHNYERSHFITFTDGIDQTSQDFSHQPNPIVSADEYYDYIIRTAKGKIDNYESDVVFVKGVDITNEQQQEKFENKLSQLAVPNNSQHYERLQSINRLEQKFSDIANHLIDSWQVLNCYVAPARHGRVCWTFGKEEKPAPAPKPEPKPVVRNGRNIFVGLNGTVGFPIGMYNASSYSYSQSYYDPYTDSYVYSSANSNNSSMDLGMNLKFGVDFAWPVADRFAIGVYTMIGGGPSMSLGNSGVDVFSGGMDFKVGLFMLAGDVNNRPFIIGIAPCTGFAMTAKNGYVPLEFRFGRVIKKHLYISGNLTFGVPLSGSFTIEPAITLGYHFGDKLKTK